MMLKAILSGFILALFSSCTHFVNRAEDREKAQIYAQMAVRQLQEKQYSKAVESCQEALKLDPQMALAYNHLALVYMETKRYQKSEESFKKALEIKPNYSEVFNNLGALMNRMERYPEAIGYFEKALSDDQYSTPENALTNMGYSYYRLGQMQKSKEFHQKALDMMPQFCLASKNMGDVYAKEKNYKKASDYFDKAVTHCPLYQEAQYKLGLTQVKLGQKNVAKAQLEKLIEKHKNGPFVEKSQEVLKYLHQ